MKNKMMIRRILIGLFLGIVVTSCTHNDGYIGPLFGKWQLIEMWENGPMTPHDSLYYNFQSSVIKLQLVHRGGIENATDNYFGSYVREDDILKFKIMEPSWFETELPPVFKLKMNEEYTFYIEKLTSSKMILTRGEDERFVFRKF